MNPARWTKAQVVFFTGVNTWTASYLDVKVAAAIAVVIAAYLAWLAPNQEPTDERQPVERWGEAGKVDLNGALAAVVLVLLILLLLKAIGYLP